jgi:hypothetical protein
MLSKFNIGLVSVLAVFTFVVAVSSASATPSWLVAGTKVASGAKFTFAEAAALSAGNSLRYENGEAEITCAGVTIEAGFIEGETKGGAEHVVVTGCTVIKPAHCAVKGGIFISTELRSHLLPSEITPEVTFEPLNGATIATFKLESSGGTCTLNGKEFKVAGHANVKIVEPTVDAVLKEIKAETGSGELTVNSEEAKMVGSLSIKLSLGFIWGIA